MKRRANYRIFLKLVEELCDLQRSHGGHYVVENPLKSFAWDEPPMKRLAKESIEAVCDQCAYGLKSPEGVLHKKGTKFLVSSEALAEQLRKRCSKDHEHQEIFGGSRFTRPTAEYPRPLAKAIIKGLVNSVDRECLPAEDIVADDEPRNVRRRIMQ